MGSVLTVTSYGNRTSPVLRAKWLLENILGHAAAAAAGRRAAVPAGSRRERRTAVGARAAGAAPQESGLRQLPRARWILSGSLSRTSTRSASGGRSTPTRRSMPRACWSTAPTFTGPAELRQTLLARQEQIVRTVAEKLLTYALGRGLEYYDAPVVRQIVAGRGAERRSLVVADPRRSSRARRFGCGGASHDRDEEGDSPSDDAAWTGRAVALPLLDGMVPAFTRAREDGGAPDQALRCRLPPERRDHRQVDAGRRRRRASSSRRS